MRKFLACALLCLAAPATAQSIEVASGDWGNIPQLRSTSGMMLTEGALQRVEQLIGKHGQCPGAQPKTINLNVPFLLEFAPSGEVRRIIVKRQDCEELERLVGTAIRDMASAGAYRATGENPENWYRGEINYVIDQN